MGYVKQEDVISLLGILADKMPKEGQVVMSQAQALVHDMYPEDVIELGKEYWSDRFNIDVREWYAEGRFAKTSFVITRKD